MATGTRYSCAKSQSLTWFPMRADVARTVAEADAVGAAGAFGLPLAGGPCNAAGEGECGAAELWGVAAELGDAVAGGVGGAVGGAVGGGALEPHDAERYA